MDLPYTSFYKDRFFWTISSMFWLAHGTSNLAGLRRLSYQWHVGLAQSFFVGYLFHSFARGFRLYNFRLFRIEAINSEYNYTQNLARNRGKFLENNEQELKEVFKTIIF